MSATCQVRVTPPGMTSGDYGRCFRQTEGVDVRWSFDDGVQIHLSTPVPRTWYPTHGRPYGTSTRELTRRPRVYVDWTGAFSVLEDLQNRCRRPHEVAKPLVREALTRIGLDGPLMWSQKAGCSCPCSPGFILTADAPGVDIWVTLPGIPHVDESKMPRVLL